MPWLRRPRDMHLARSPVLQTRTEGPHRAIPSARRLPGCSLASGSLRWRSCLRRGRFALAASAPTGPYAPATARPHPPARRWSLRGCICRVVDLLTCRAHSPSFALRVDSPVSLLALLAEEPVCRSRHCSRRRRVLQPFDTSGKFGVLAQRFLVREKGQCVHRGGTQVVVLIVIEHDLFCLLLELYRSQRLKRARAGVPHLPAFVLVLQNVCEQVLGCRIGSQQANGFPLRLGRRRVLHHVPEDGVMLGMDVVAEQLYGLLRGDQRFRRILQTFE